MGILEVQNLSVRYETSAGDVRALDSVSFKVDPGERLGIVGESGSGKSSLGFGILGLIPFPGKVKSGAILFEGKDVTIMDERQREKMRGMGVTMIFQDPKASLNPLATIGEHFKEIFVYHFRMKSKAAWQERTVGILREVGITDPEKRLGQYPHQLSGGMAQRILIALALAQSPKVIIADEITTGLDVTLQVQILDLLKSLAEQKKTAFILISHDIGVVSYFSERVIVMYAGMIMEEGATREVFGHPYHPYTKALIASLPTGGKRILRTIEGEPPSLLQEFGTCPFAPRCPWKEDKCMSLKPPLRERDQQKIACFFDIQGEA